MFRATCIVRGKRLGEMGGMFTILKARGSIRNYDDAAGWYQHFKGTVADLAAPDEIRRSLGKL